MIVHKCVSSSSHPEVYCCSHGWQSGKPVSTKTKRSEMEKRFEFSTHLSCLSKIRSMILTHSNLEYLEDTKMGNYDHQPSIVFCSSHRNCRNWPVFVHLQVCGWMQDIQQDEWLVCLVYETGINLLRSLILQHHIYSQFFRKIWNVDQLSLCSAFIKS